MSFYGNVGTPFLGSGLYGSSYLSSKHLKRAMKYGSYHAPVHSISAPAVYGSSYLGGATVIHAPVVQDSFVQAPVERVSAPAAVYSSQHFDGHYAPVEHTVMAAPVVHAPVYTSRYYSKGGYRSSRSYFGNYIGGSVYSGAPVVHAPVEHVSAPAVYGSSYLSSKHLKRAMKYGSYHAPVHSISAPAVYGSSYLGGATVIHAPVVQDSFVQVLRGVGSGPGFVLPVDEDRVQETSTIPAGIQKMQIRSGIMRVMKRYGTSESPPQNELFALVKKEVQRWIPLPKAWFTYGVEALLEDGMLVRVNPDTGTMRVREPSVLHHMHRKE